MKNITSTGSRRNTGRWIVAAVLVATAVAMYISIMLKIIKYGP